MNIAHTPLKSLLEGTRSKQYEHGQLILYAGDKPLETLILTSGIIKVFTTDTKGQEKVLQIIKAPAILPLDCLFEAPHTVSWYYGALTDVEAHVFSPEELHTHLAKNLTLSTYIINWLAVESHELLVRLSGMSKSEAKDKIVTVLKFFSVYYTQAARRGGWKKVEFPVTHQLLADIAGITRESATIQMGELKRERIIRSRRPNLDINTERLFKNYPNDE
ncbi:MAG TPA: Crp/Fnr family transcriptional regulator [Candidatus Saccharimonadales bacterium]|nr:Crp/Fnr family transcriptional regulator [Candidatus Saccharimonadales bacterium]